MKAWWPGQGDWGTQFGMLIQHLEETREGGLDGLKGDEAISDLQALYKAAKARFDAEPDFKLRAREAVTRLQAGELLFLRVRANKAHGGMKHCWVDGVGRAGSLRVHSHLLLHSGCLQQFRTWQGIGHFCVCKMSA